MRKINESFEEIRLNKDEKHIFENSVFYSYLVKAKLVEMIYSKERNLLKQFASEADTSNAKNGHSMAANRIVEGFKRFGKDIDACSIDEIQKIAKQLFDESNNEI